MEFVTYTLFTILLLEYFIDMLHIRNIARISISSLTHFHLRDIIVFSFYLSLYHNWVLYAAFFQCLYTANIDLVISGSDRLK